VLAHVHHQQAPARHDQALEVGRLGSTLVGGEGQVDDGVVGEGIEQSQQEGGVAAGGALGEVPVVRGGRGAWREGDARGTEYGFLGRGLAAVDLDQGRNPRRVGRRGHYVG